MKAKLKKTGEIINIAEYANVTLDKCDSYGTPIQIGFDEVEEFLDDNGLPLGFEKQMKAPRPIILEPTPTVDWEQIRINASIAAMQSLIASQTDSSGKIDVYKTAEASVFCADALIEELKKQK